jgi:hypothetical protein
MSLPEITALSAYQAVPEICEEVREFGEPANPTLARLLRGSYQALKEGGAVTGFYGSGKTLIAALSAFAENALGGKATVLAAYRVLKAEEGTVNLSDVAIDITEEFEERCGEELSEWLSKVFGRQSVKGAGTVGAKVDVEVKGSGLNRLLNVIKDLVNKGFTLIVVDEFERVVEMPTQYGFHDFDDLRDRFFEMVDRWPRANAGLTIPTTLWVYLDLQTRRRIASLYHLTMNITTDDMRRFLERKLGKIPNELSEVEFRNPAVVSEIVRDVKSKGADGVLRDRIEWLRRIAESYPRAKMETKRALHAAYLAAWFMQNIYAEIPSERLRKAAELIKSEDPVERLYSKRRHNKLLIKVTNGYMLAAPVITHVMNVVKSAEMQHALGLEYVVDRIRLELEIP